MADATEDVPAGHGLRAPMLWALPTVVVLAVGSFGSFAWTEWGWSWLSAVSFGDTATWVQGVATLSLLAFTVHQQTTQNQNIATQLRIQDDQLDLEQKDRINTQLPLLMQRARELAELAADDASTDWPMTNALNELKRAAIPVGNDWLVASTLRSVQQAYDNAGDEPKRRRGTAEAAREMELALQLYSQSQSSRRVNNLAIAGRWDPEPPKSSRK